MDSARAAFLEEKIPAITDFRARGTIMGPAGLTAVFGMGTGGTPQVWSPEIHPGGRSNPPGRTFAVGSRRGEIQETPPRGQDYLEQARVMTHPNSRYRTDAYVGPWGTILMKRDVTWESVTASFD
jgi:hypothetical protein